MIIKPRHVWFAFRLVIDLIIWSIALSIIAYAVRAAWEFIYLRWKRASERISKPDKSDRN